VRDTVIRRSRVDHPSCMAASKRGYVLFRLAVASWLFRYHCTCESVPSRLPAPLPRGLDGEGERLLFMIVFLGFVWLVGRGLSEGAEWYGCGGSLKSLVVLLMWFDRGVMMASLEDVKSRIFRSSLTSGDSWWFDVIRIPTLGNLVLASGWTPLTCRTALRYLMFSVADYLCIIVRLKRLEISTERLGLFASLVPRLRQLTWTDSFVFRLVDSKTAYLAYLMAGFMYCLPISNCLICRVVVLLSWLCDGL
jgi:hypothetical protein